MNDRFYLNPAASFKIYGKKIYLYQKDTDSLFAIDDEAYRLLKQAFEGLNPKLIDSEVLSFLTAEGILLPEKPKSTELKIGIFPHEDQPPLKYLHLIITTSCNLRCSHCYVEHEESFIEPEVALKAALEFEKIGGLRLIVSGGEPLLHPEFEKINEGLKSLYGIRKILNTNGWFLAEMEIEQISNLAFEEIQLSLDGTEKTHDKIRSKGSFEKVLRAAEKVKQSGKHLALATVITGWNYKEFDKIEKLVKKFQPFRWSVDFLCPNERTEAQGLNPPLDAAFLMERSFNSGKHESQPGFACGANLCSVLTNGSIVKCDFFPYITGGNIRKKSLLKAWLDLKKIKIEELECKDCAFIDSCGGGCRYRAMYYNKNQISKDPAYCMLYGCYEGS